MEPEYPFKFPMEFSTINDNVVCEQAILVVVSHECVYMSLVRYRAS